ASTSPLARGRGEGVGGVPLALPIGRQVAAGAASQPGGGVVRATGGGGGAALGPPIAGAPSGRRGGQAGAASGTAGIGVGAGPVVGGWSTTVGASAPAVLAVWK